MVGLENRGMQVRDRCSRSRHNNHRKPGLDREPQGHKSADALVDAHMQPQQTRALILGRRESEGLRAGTGTQHHIPQAQPGKLVEEGYGEGGSRGLTPRACHHRGL